MRESHNPQATAQHRKADASAAGDSVPEWGDARILRFKQVAALVGLAKSSIYRKVQEGTFPKPIKLGSVRASGWISTEVYDWINDQVRRSRNV
jgi:prophage regulatory protein